MSIFLRSILHKLSWGNCCFLDPILSGSESVSCATCHHPRFNTADGISLGIGDVGVGLGSERVIDAANPPEKRIPRNTPALFNLGAAELVSFFLDERLEVNKTRTSGIHTPLGGEMEGVFATCCLPKLCFPYCLLLQWQGIFPKTMCPKQCVKVC